MAADTAIPNPSLIGETMPGKFIDLTGQTFADLTAIKRTGSTKDGAVWLWKCVCGKEAELTAHCVKRGHNLSCGCRRARNAAAIREFNSRPENRKKKWAKYARKQKEYYNDNLGIYLRNVCKARAKKLGVPYRLTPEDFVIPSHCPVLGIELRRGTKGFHDDAPSVDRIIPELGYTKGNIAIISWKANRIKSNATCEEIQKLAAWLQAQTKPFLLPAAA